jgi:hypothetical protein
MIIINGADMRTCTWKGCVKEAIHPHLDKNGAVWSELCEQHHLELEDTTLDLDKFDARRHIRSWILAHGGAELLSKKLAPAVVEGVKRMLQL